ncbi:hypothetical protein DB346_02325 [Verrucomicrobia bacterium LW23]|nr:hypothetical protein DB346_02325 [Verrucomicrobia bacterium LW23]
MVELVSVAGILVVAACQLFLSICGARFGTLLLLMVGGLPPLVFINYLVASRMMPVSFVRGAGEPLPPEIYYWVLTRDKIWAAIRFLLLVLPFGWLVAFVRAPEFPVGSSSLCSWCVAFVVLMATARLIALSFLYVLASQTIDRASPRFIGIVRRWLFHHTNNTDFLR